MVKNSAKSNHIVDIGQYDPIFKYFEDYHYLLRPLSGAAAGFVAGGIPGAALGVGTVLVDSTCEYYTGKNAGFFISSFLTGSMLNIASQSYKARYFIIEDGDGGFGNIAPYYAFQAGIVATSVVSNIASKAGLFEAYPEIIDNAVIAGFGAYSYGPAGAGIGAAASITDVLLQRYNVTSDSYLSKAVVSNAMLNFGTGLIAPSEASGTVYSAVYNAISVANEVLYKAPEFAASAAGGYYLSDYVDVSLVDPIKQYSDIGKSFEKIMDGNRNILSLVQDHSLVSMGIGVAHLHYMSQLLRDFSSFKGTAVLVAKAEGDARTAEYNKILHKGFVFLGGILRHIAFKQTTETSKAYFTTKLMVTLQDQQMKGLLAKGTALALHNNKEEDVKKLLDSFDDNLWAMCSDGLQINYEIVELILKSVFGGVYSISNQAQNAIMATFVMQSLSKIPTQLLNELAGEYGIQAKDITAERKAVQHSLQENVKTITEAGGEEYIKNQMQDNVDSLRPYQIGQQHAATFTKMWGHIVGWTGHLASTLASLKLLFEGKISFDDLLNISVFAEDSIEVFAYKASNAAKFKAIESAIERVQKVMDLIHAAQQDSPDKIARIFDAGHLGFDLEVFIDQVNKLLLDAEIQLENGTYALTGASGSGKSSFVSKIINIANNGIRGEGEISYPASSLDEVVYVTQQDYMPQNSTLYESIMYPMLRAESNAQKDNFEPRILQLMQRLNFDGYSSDNQISAELHKIKDWGSTLSGGQLKKVQLIRGLVKEAEVIIFDEIFNGMDSKSIIEAQKIITEFMGEKWVIVIDHHAADNNYVGFYSGGEVHLENQQISRLNLTEILLPDADENDPYEDAGTQDIQENNACYADVDVLGGFQQSPVCAA